MKHPILSTTFALVLITAPAFVKAQRSKSEIPPHCYDAGYEIKQGQMASGYNHPGGINTEGWDVFINASFLFWEARQDGMSLGLPNSFPTTSGFRNDKVTYQNFRYKPGFKVAAGFKSDSFDDWGALIEYTRLHGSYSTGATAPETPNGVIRMVPWWSNQTNQNAFAFTSTWKMDYDVIDFGLFRTYYVGRLLGFSTYFGGRGGWIDQSLNLSANIVNQPAAIPSPATSQNSVDSWFIGPRAAVNISWIFGYGLRLVGNTSLSVVFQRFHSIVHDQSETDDPAQNGHSLFHRDNQIRPNMDMQFGIGWGIYAWNQKVHFDLEATYGFTIWWAQNMMRMLADQLGSSAESSPGNLYFQGLTVRGQLNF